MTMSSDENAAAAVFQASLSVQENSNVNDKNEKYAIDSQNEQQEEDCLTLEEPKNDTDNHPVLQMPPPPPPSCLSRETLACLKTTLAFVIIKRKWQKKHKIEKQKMMIHHHHHDSGKNILNNTAGNATATTTAATTATASSLYDATQQQQKQHPNYSSNNSFAHRQHHIEHMMQQALTQVRQYNTVRNGLAMHLATQISAALFDDDDLQQQQQPNTTGKQQPLSAVELALSENSISNSTREPGDSSSTLPATNKNNFQQQNQEELEEEMAATTDDDDDSSTTTIQGRERERGSIMKCWIQATFLQPRTCQEATDMAMVWCAILQQTTSSGIATVQSQQDDHYHDNLVLHETLYDMLTKLLQATIDERKQSTSMAASGGRCSWPAAAAEEFLTPALAISFLPVWISTLKQQQQCVTSTTHQQQRLQERNDALAAWLGLTPQATTSSTSITTFSSLTLASLADCYLTGIRQVSRRRHHSGIGRGRNGALPSPPVNVSSPLARVADCLFLRHIMTSHLQKYWTATTTTLPSPTTAQAPLFFCSATEEEEEAQEQQQQQQHLSPTNMAYFSVASWPATNNNNTPDLPVTGIFH